ncbi:sensor histidine kinase [Allobranchiibius sp. GilTou38]|uniref:sensor histidine kinase n=1 Tax=Allobranchiibius sp. GilTou38 TaxID=2815210 RepID=UPI001AA1BCE5|nr:sensor histidine kinase [Allobranchiibius sp. GilTou38]MBO1766631.1 sensor domain-containing protein [Allobranchiibius sp. GilTou38]
MDAADGLGSPPGAEAPGGQALRRSSTNPLRLARTSFRQLTGGLGSALLAMVLLALLAASWILCVVGIGFLVLPTCLRTVRPLADRERVRLTRWGDAIESPAAPVPAPRDHLVDPTARRELAWLVLHGTVDVALGIIGLALPLAAVGALGFPFWRNLSAGQSIPRQDAEVHWALDDPSHAWAVTALGVALVAAVLLVTPALTRLQAVAGRLLLPPPDEGDMSLRIAELTATRAAALDAHAIELRRIERALHDGAQNRLVAVNVLLGGVRQAVLRDPATALEAVDRAQTATEAALAELRSVARAILPPVLTDRGLGGALDGLAAASPIPCRLEVDLRTRCAAATEATAYFAVAEALTNAARHSGAKSIVVTVRSDSEHLHVAIQDDGAGGATDRKGSGLLGIRRRAEALDGTMSIRSPRGGPTRLEVDLPCGS